MISGQKILQIFLEHPLWNDNKYSTSVGVFVPYPFDYPDPFCFYDIFQIDVDYNIPDPTNKPSFKLNVNLLEEDDLLGGGVFPPGRKRRGVGDELSNEITNIEQYKVTIETCTR